MDSTLPRNSQLIPDSRYYIVRYTLLEAGAGNLDSSSLSLDFDDQEDAKHSYRNSTDLNLMIDDLRPASEYEFAVKVVRGRRQSGWSLVVNNHTREAAPASAPR